MTDNCPRLFNWLCQNWKPCLSLNFQPNCPSLYAQNSRKSSSQLPAEPNLLFTSILWSLCMCKLPTNVASVEFKYELCLSLFHIVATESCSFAIWNVQMHTTTRSGMQSGPCQRVYVSQPPKWWDCSHGWFGLGSSVCLQNVIRYSCPTWIAVSHNYYDLNHACRLQIWYLLKVQHLWYQWDILLYHVVLRKHYVRG